MLFPHHLDQRAGFRRSLSCMPFRMAISSRRSRALVSGCRACDKVLRSYRLYPDALGLAVELVGVGEARKFGHDC